MAASNASVSFLMKDGSSYVVDAYVPDATATYLTFNATGLAASTSSAVLTVPKGAVAINDVSVVAAPTAVGFNITLDSASQPGYTLRHANFLATLAKRMSIFLPVKEGQQLQAIQF